MVECCSCYAECCLHLVSQKAVYAVCYYAKCHYAECYYAKCHYAECYYVKCHYAECCGAKFTPYLDCEAADGAND